MGGARLWVVNAGGAVRHRAAWIFLWRKGVGGFCAWTVYWWQQGWSGMCLGWVVGADIVHMVALF